MHTAVPPIRFTFSSSGDRLSAGKHRLFYKAKQPCAVSTALFMSSLTCECSNSPYGLHFVSRCESVRLFIGQRK